MHARTNKKSPYCDGISRRDFVRVGTAMTLGTSLSLDQLLECEARAAEAQGGASGDSKSCIFIFFVGGASSIDMWDMKVNASSEIRGPFHEISTNVPGTRICEHLPKLAKMMDKFALVRSLSHTDGTHGSADHWMMTGYKPGPGFVSSDNMINNQRPCHGSVVARQLGPRGAVPPYIALPSMPKSGGSAYLGATAAPFLIDTDPSAPDFAVRDLQLAMNVDSARLEDRRGLIRQLDRYQKSVELEANHHAGAINTYYEKAFELITSPQAKQAFDITKEDPKVRDAYGRHSLGQSCLMARRLVEAGARFVTVEHGNWDTHAQNFISLETNLLPQVDTAITALVNDLDDRGMLDNTLVIPTSEFGRTPTINKDAGRDHWPNVMTVPFAGGGVVGGRVIGASDARAEAPATEPFTPEDMAATIYKTLGVDYSQTYYDPLGRPLPILDSGRPIRELFS
ncbi:MAG: DUF1501 domain-containing protein [Pirellulales bacterium]